MRDTRCRKGASRRDGMFAEVEVATTAANASDAHVRITGPVGRAGASMLAAVLNAHLRVGRCYFSIDVAEASLGDDAASCLAETARAAAALGGALTLENAGPRAARSTETV